MYKDAHLTVISLCAVGNLSTGVCTAIRQGCGAERHLTKSSIWRFIYCRLNGTSRRL